MCAVGWNRSVRDGCGLMTDGAGRVPDKAHGVGRRHVDYGRNASEAEAMVADMQEAASRWAGLELVVPTCTWSSVQRHAQLVVAGDHAFLSCG